MFELAWDFGLRVFKFRVEGSRFFVDRFEGIRFQRLARGICRVYTTRDRHTVLLV